MAKLPSKGQKSQRFLASCAATCALCSQGQRHRRQGLAGRPRIYLSTDEVEPGSRSRAGVLASSPSAPSRDGARDAAITDPPYRWPQARAEPDPHLRVRARRADKAISPDLRRDSAATWAAPSPSHRRAGRISRTTPRSNIGIEVPPQRALVYGDVSAAPGMPLGSQGRVVVLLSSGIDSPVAAWLMMKRGCTIIPVHFSISEAQSRQVQSLVDALNRYAYGWQLKPIILSHHEILGPALDQLRAAQRERWACLFCSGHATQGREIEKTLRRCHRRPLGQGKPDAVLIWKWSPTASTTDPAAPHRPGQVENHRPWPVRSASVEHPTVAFLPTSPGQHRKAPGVLAAIQDSQPALESGKAMSMSEFRTHPARDC